MYRVYHKCRQKSSLILTAVPFVPLYQAQLPSVGLNLPGFVVIVKAVPLIDCPLPPGFFLKKVVEELASRPLLNVDHLVRQSGQLSLPRLAVVDLNLKLARPEVAILPGAPAVIAALELAKDDGDTERIAEPLGHQFSGHPTGGLLDILFAQCALTAN